MIWFLDKLRQKEERELAAIEAQPQLFEEDEFSRQKTFDLKAPILEKIEIINDQQKDVDKITAPFNWGLDFFEIIELRGGFDIVIANPPYGVKVDTTVRDEFGVQSKDSYGVFTVLGLRILRPGGTLCYIMSDTWQTIRSHKKLRNTLLKETDTQYLISVPPDVFAATVNTGVYSFMKRLAPREKYGRDADNWILAADFSPLKIRQENGQLDSGDLEAAFELLIEELDGLDETKDGYTITSGRDFAIFAYRQKLIPRFSNHSFFIASPKLFGLMRDVGNVKNPMESARGETPIYSVDFNGKELELVKLGDVSDVVGGVKTYDNKKYVRSASANGRYDQVDTDLTVNRSLTTHEKKKGIKRVSPQTPYFLPFDKSGKMISKDNVLLNYWKPIEFYLDWSRAAVRFYALHNGLRNKHRYFQQGITYSVTGVYAPTFRIGCGYVFGQKGASIFSDGFQPIVLLGILASKLARYFFKSFVSGGVDVTDSMIAEFPLIKVYGQQEMAIKNGTERIINTIRKSDHSTAQCFIDGLDKVTFNTYNLNREDIQEVEDWYFRRYPKLAWVIEEKLNAKAGGME